MVKSIYKKPRMALYGNIAIPKGYCPKCKEIVFIRNGLFVCCNNPVQVEPQKFHRETESPQKRKTPPKTEKSKILEQQENCCFYCNVTFETIRYRNGKPFTIKIDWDHKLPFSYSQNNTVSNFVAACHVCNRIKSNVVFRTIEEAQVHLADKRRLKGYDF